MGVITDHEGLAVLRQAVLQKKGQGGVAEGNVLVLLSLSYRIVSYHKEKKEMSEGLATLP